MSFWRTFGFHTISPVENILDRENFTLEELLDEEDILQETKAQNKKLIDYFVKDEVLSKFVFYLTQEPEESADAKRKFKYPFVCCEILCSEVWSICEAFFEQDKYASDLLSFFYREGKLNPLLAGYVCKVCSSLLAKKSSELLGLMRKKEDLIGKLMKHLNTSAVMDLLLKIIVTSEDSSVENNEAVLIWLRDSKLITRLIEHFNPSFDAEIHENVATALIEIIVAFASNPTSPLLAQLESEDTVKQLLEFATTPGTSPYGLTVVIELLGRNVAEQFNSSGNVAELNPLLRTVCGHVDKLLQVLKQPQQKKFQMTFGELVPLGFYRLKVVEFFSALVKVNCRAINEVLMKQGVFHTVLDLFFQYAWHNFLHLVLDQMMVGLLSGADLELKKFMITECKLPQRLMQASKEAEEDFAKPNGVKKGYMAFVSNIATALLNEAQKTAELQTLLAAVHGWDVYVTGPLAEAKNLENKPLGGAKPLVPELEPDDSLGNEMVLKYLAQQGFVKDFSDANAPDDDDDDDDENGAGRFEVEDPTSSAIGTAFMARGLFSVTGGQGQFGGNDSDEDDPTFIRREDETDSTDRPPLNNPPDSAPPPPPEGEKTDTDAPAAAVSSTTSSSPSDTQPPPASMHN